MHRYEIRYESATSNGSRMILAATESEALSAFAAGYAESGDPVPSHWVVGVWEIG